MLTNGTQAPNFKLLSTVDDDPISIAEFKGHKRVVLAFYPKDFTPTCTTEVSTLNSLLNKFEALNAQVLGISVDSIETHREFAEERKLQFPLLADDEPKGYASSLYESYNEAKGYSNRTFYIIDKKSNIFWSYEVAAGEQPDINKILTALGTIGTADNN